MTTFQSQVFDAVYVESVLKYLTTIAIPTDISHEYYANALMLNCAAEAHNYCIQLNQQPKQ